MPNRSIAKAMRSRRTLTSYLCLDTAQYIHLFYNECSRVLEKFVRVSGVYVHTGADTH